jgi:hypothetical protein
LENNVIDIPKTVGAVAASVAALGGGYTLVDKIGWLDRAIIEWAPEHFSIEPAKIGSPITVTVARIKKRDDCSVESFVPAIRDGQGVVHEAVSSNPKFSGPAGPEIDTFTYTLTVKTDMAAGRSTLLATIKYKCPEGDRVVTYPRHKNLTFNLSN